MGESNGPANSLAGAEPVPCSVGSQDQLPNQAAILKLKTAVVRHILDTEGRAKVSSALHVVLEGWDAGSGVSWLDLWGSWELVR